MMTVLHHRDGSHTIIATGDGARELVKKIEEFPPPFPVVNFKADNVYDPKIFDPEEGAEIDRLTREVQHYATGMHEKSVHISILEKRLAEAQERVKQQERITDAGMDAAQKESSRLHAELEATKQAKKKAPAKAKALPVPHLNGTAKRK